MSSTTPGYSLEQIQLLHKAGWFGTGGFLQFSRMYVRLNQPRTAKALLPVFRLVRHGVYAVRGLRHRLASDSPTADDPTESLRA